MFLSYRWRYCVQVEWTCEPLDSPSSCELTDILISLIVVHARLVYIHMHTMTKCGWGSQQNLSGLWPSRQNKRSFGGSARWHCIASGWIPAFFVFYGYSCYSNIHTPQVRLKGVCSWLHSKTLNLTFSFCDLLPTAASPAPVSQFVSPGIFFLLHPPLLIFLFALQLVLGPRELI